ncbi:hypothetical protein Csa_015491 [Cucumis sativus]|uniref:Uncharacterized protein n=1 Tax=Cucumis sativus TaxID=3659 RepID=A0A0A0LBC7_CUCSA|nr:hypothetical protein Csa_015491 [Cucumis sativus]
MSSENCNARAMNSSIALLQERFRQLQKAKELREQKEFRRMSSESIQANTAVCSEQTGLYFHSELVLPPRSPLQGSSYLQPVLESRKSHLQVTDNLTLSDVGSREKVMHRTNCVDDSNIDTSLHL